MPSPYFAFRRTECNGYLFKVKVPPRKHLDHVPPHWIKDAAVYFITLCAAPKGMDHFCSPSVGREVLSSIRHYHDRGRWFCHLVVLMPDHIHLLLSFPDISSFSRLIGEWKKWLVKHQAIRWQDNFFDHRLRDDENFDRKAEYILQNPVRAGLVKEAKDWAYTWMPDRT